MKRKQNLRPDTVLKNYWDDRGQFADLFNAVLFGGRQVIKAEELEDAGTEESTVLEHRGYAESVRASRDSIRIHKRCGAHGMHLVMLGIENQEHVHYAMPLRVMGYDYGTYRKQYDRNAGRYRTAGGMDGDEYLSGMKRTDRFLPVITVVVYYGEKEWDGATTLHEMLDIQDEIKEYVSDYKMVLVEARKNGLTLHNGNNNDLFNLLQILLDRNRPIKETKQKAIDYVREHEVDRTVLMTVAGAANCNIDYNVLTKKGDADMCTVFEEVRMEGVTEGRAKGITEGIAKGITEGRAKGITEGRAEEIVETGLEFSLSENDILERLQKKLGISLQAAQEYFRMFGKQII